MSAVLPAEVVDPPRQSKPRRCYSEMEKARALALFDMCGSLTETANKSGIPDSTLSQWINSQTLAKNTRIPILRNEAGLSLAQDFQEIAYEVASVALRKLRSKGADKIPFGQLMTGGGIAVDRYQLLSGLPTNISASMTSPEERQSKVSELLARIEARAIEVEVEPAQIEGETTPE